MLETAYQRSCITIKCLQVTHGFGEYDCMPAFTLTVLIQTQQACNMTLTVAMSKRHGLRRPVDKALNRWQHVFAMSLDLTAKTQVEMMQLVRWSLNVPTART